MRRIDHTGLVRFDQRLAIVEKDAEEPKPSKVTLYEATQVAIDDRLNELTADGTAARTSDGSAHPHLAAGAGPMPRQL